MKRLNQIWPIAVFCCTAVGVNAQTVEISGRIDAALTYAKTAHGTSLPGGAGTRNPGGSVYRLDSNIGPGNRLTIRGTEDLGGGLRALFHMEHGFTADTGTTTQAGVFWGRQMFMGLAGATWSLTAGRQYSPINNAVAFSDALGGVYWGLLGQQAVGISFMQFGSNTPGTSGAIGRQDNSLLYTQSFGPVRAQMMVSLGNETTSGGAGRLINPAITYVNGPLGLTASIARAKTASDITAPGRTPEWQTMSLLGGNYDFGKVKMFTGLSKVERASVGTYTPASQLAWDSMRAYWLGAKVQTPSGAFYAQYVRSNFDNRIGPDGHSDQYALTYEHFLSKRTNFYVSYGTRRLDANTRGNLIATITSAGPDIGYGARHTGVSVGVAHAF